MDEWAKLQGFQPWDAGSIPAGVTNNSLFLLSLFSSLLWERRSNNLLRRFRARAERLQKKNKNFFKKPIDKYQKPCYNVITKRKGDKKMAELINLKERVIAKYGKDSFEAGYIQHVFATRPSDYFKRICSEMLKGE